MINTQSRNVLTILETISFSQLGAYRSGLISLLKNSSGFESSFPDSSDDFPTLSTGSLLLFDILPCSHFFKICARSWNHSYGVVVRPFASKEPWISIWIRNTRLILRSSFLVNFLSASEKSQRFVKQDFLLLIPHSHSSSLPVCCFDLGVHYFFFLCFLLYLSHTGVQASSCQYFPWNAFKRQHHICLHSKAILTKLSHSSLVFWLFYPNCSFKCLGEYHSVLAMFLFLFLFFMH